LKWKGIALGLLLFSLISVANALDSSYCIIIDKDKEPLCLFIDDLQVDIGTDCGAGDCVYGVNDDGSLDCRACSGGGGVGGLWETEGYMIFPNASATPATHLNVSTLNATQINITATSGTAPILISSSTEAIDLNVSFASIAYNASLLDNYDSVYFLPLNDTWDVILAKITGSLNVTDWSNATRFNGTYYGDASNAIFSHTYLANETIVVGGTYDSGNLASIQTIEDDDSYNVSEDAGANPLTIEVNFTNVTTFDSVIMMVEYSGGLGHKVQFEILRTDTGAWENYIDLTDMTDFANVYIPVLDSQNHVDSHYNVSVRFYHSQSGIPTHAFAIDYIALVDGMTTLTGIEHDALSGRGNVENHPQYFPTDASRNITGDTNITGSLTIYQKDLVISDGDNSQITLNYATDYPEIAVNEPDYAHWGGAIAYLSAYDSAGYIAAYERNQVGSAEFVAGEFYSRITITSPDTGDVTVMLDAAEFVGGTYGTLDMSHTGGSALLKTLPDEDALALGSSIKEGGDISVWRDTSDNKQFYLDADATENVIGMELFAGQKIGVTNPITLNGSSGTINASNITVSNAIYAGDWSNVSIIESQISDLAHTTDTNASTICSNDYVLAGNETCVDIFGNEWITPSEIIDVDKEDIETDLNTFLDVGGDEWAGNQTMSSNKTHWLGNLSYMLGGIVAEFVYEGGIRLSNLYCSLTGCNMTGNIDMGENDITNITFTDTSKLNSTEIFINELEVEAHRKWSWADEMSWTRSIFIPYSYGGWVHKGSALTRNTTAGTWDDYDIQMPFVILHNGTYYLYYAGRSANDWATAQIGLATSTDSLNFIRHFHPSNNGLIIPPMGDFDAITFPSVIYDEYETNQTKKWKMSVNHLLGSDNTPALYVSSNGTTWFFEQNITGLTNFLESICLFRIGNAYFMFYESSNNVIRLSVARDNSTHTIGVPYNHGVVIDKGGSGTWNEDRVLLPGLFWNSGVWYIIYTGVDTSASPNQNRYQLGMATSNTGFNFTDIPMNPVLGNSTVVDGTIAFIAGSALMMKENEFFLYASHNTPDDAWDNVHVHKYELV